MKLKPKHQVSKTKNLIEKKTFYGAISGFIFMI